MVYYDNAFAFTEALETAPYYLINQLGSYHI